MIHPKISVVTCAGVVERLDSPLGHVDHAVHLEHAHVLFVQGDVPPEGDWKETPEAQAHTCQVGS